MDDLKSIRVFLEVAGQRSFAGAARTLGMTPASVTRILARLEEELGLQLLLRTTRKVSLTSAGAMVAARFAPLVEGFDDARAEIARASLPDRGRLRISAPLSMGLKVLPDLLPAFQARYPDIEVSLNLTDRLVDILEDDCDLAIRISEAPQDKSTIWRKICEVPRVIVAAPALFKRIAPVSAPEDLSPDVCLSYSQTGQPERWLLRREQSERAVRAGSRVVTNSGDMLLSLVGKGHGMALLPRFMAQEGLDRGTLVQVLPDWQVKGLWLTLFYPPYDRLPPLVTTFSDFFETHIRDKGLAFAWG